MINLFKNFELEKISFFIGFLTASLLWLAVSKFRTWIPEIVANIKKYIKNIKSMQSSGIQNAIRSEAYLTAQQNHLAKSLFFLNQILIEPRLLAEPIFIHDDEKVFFESEVALTVPYTPDFPFLSRNLNVPRITITEAIQKGADLVICGAPGSGKTVALAHLVSSLAQRNPNCGLSSSKIPLYINIHDTDILNSSEFSLVELLQKIFLHRLPSSQTPKLMKFLPESLKDNSAILIIDGMDELHPNEFDKAVKFIDTIKKIYNDLQIVVTASHLYLGELLTINFSALVLSPWSNDQILDFYSRWDRLWKQEIIKTKSVEDPLSILLQWSSTNLRPLSPLEFTLFIWGVLSGDLSGYTPNDLIKSFIRRVLPIKEFSDVSEYLSHIIFNEKSFSFYPGNLKGDNFSKIIQSDLYQQWPGGNGRFVHSEVFSYIASLYLDEINLPEIDLTDFKWVIYNSLLAFQSSKTSNPDWLKPILGNHNSRIPFDFFSISSWLKNTNPSTNWRNNYIKQLVRIIQDNNSKFSVKLRAMAGMVYSNDHNLPIFLRQLLEHKNDSFKKLALFAISSMNRDDTFIPDLISLSQKSSSDTQKLTSLALSTYRDESTIHELARVLLNGDETVRHVVAESLAFMDEPGTEILKEAVTLEDIVVRRAAIYGLVKMNDFWAIQTLKDMTIQDNQWVVRNFSSQALDYLQGENPYIPTKKIQLTDTPWLIEFAAKDNLGITNPQAAVNELLKALNSEDQIIIQKAISSALQGANPEIFYRLEEIFLSNLDQNISNNLFVALFFLYHSRIKV